MNENRLLSANGEMITLYCFACGQKLKGYDTKIDIHWRNDYAPLAEIKIDYLASHYCISAITLFIENSGE